ncbi:MAG: glycosyl hydrolase [FCB group bacterium]|jgi:hypothetical protein|nr:glycosyl hydrolase [FCB group bacterium]
MKSLVRWVAVLVLLGYGAAWAKEMSFENPPASDRPWVYWFWKNGNIDREAITADLESMQKVGIGGFILMEVSLSVPPGEYKFFSPEWRGMFKHAVEEANRLGLQVSMNSAPGWTGSGGPWVTPEQSMQKVVFSETQVAGGQRVEVDLPQPEAFEGFYRDIAVIAFPSMPGDYRIEEIINKALYARGPFTSMPGVPASYPIKAEYEDPPKDSIVPLGQVVDLTAQAKDGARLTWDAPAGNWTVLRIGHTSTGQTNRPAPLPGLECDKLDPEALDAHFEAFIDVLMGDIEPEARKALVAVHLDSWEVGAQNWSRHFREEFKKRRGYDLLPYFPVMTGRVVESLEISERFLWDLRQTVSELIVENHGKRLRKLANERGLWFSVEPYDMTPCADMSLGATADVPMCEFWTNTFDSVFSVVEATSVAHVYDRPVVPAESFTSVDSWTYHPGMIKAHGDWAFSMGINRIVFHRFIHTPFSNARPGLSLGPHGLHYERTEPWWDYSTPWHEYLARCQHVLRQGQFVSDVLYLSPEGAPNVFLAPNPAPAGYKFDGCTPEALLTRVTARDGQMVLPNGARYSLLVLPKSETMTPELLEKVRELSAAGVPIVGAPPVQSPSLTGYPECDARVLELAAALKEHLIAPEDNPPKGPDDSLYESLLPARWIWYTGDDPNEKKPVGFRYFRRTFDLPSDPAVESARIVLTADNAFTLYVNGTEAGAGSDRKELYPFDVTALLKPGANVIAIAAENKGTQPNNAGLVASLAVKLKDGRETVVSTDTQWMSSAEASDSWTGDAPAGTWTAALDLAGFGKYPWGEVGRKSPRIDPYADSSQVEALLKGMNAMPDFESDAELKYVHRRIDTQDVYFVANGSDKPVEAACMFRVAGKDVELWQPETGAKRKLNPGNTSEDGRTVLSLRFEPLESYFLVFNERDPKAVLERVDRPVKPDFPTYRPVIEMSGPWSVAFDPKSGGPAEPVVFDALSDWAQRPEEGIRYYSGEATYTKTFDVPADALKQPLYLDLGQVEVSAAVKVNGKDVGIAWKQPYRVALGDAVKAGANTLEVRVVNLWPNRMIGDEKLPPDVERKDDGTIKAWPQWLLEGKTSPTGRYTFASWKYFAADSPLLSSGLLGPVKLLAEE